MNRKFETKALFEFLFYLDINFFFIYLMNWEFVLFIFTIRIILSCVLKNKSRKKSDLCIKKKNIICIRLKKKKLIILIFKSFRKGLAHTYFVLNLFFEWVNNLNKYS